MPTFLTVFDWLARYASVREWGYPMNLEKKKASQRRYDLSPKGRQTHRLRQQRYRSRWREERDRLAQALHRIRQALLRRRRCRCRQQPLPCASCWDAIMQTAFGNHLKLFPGAKVQLHTPDNPRLHGATATVTLLTDWGAHVATSAADSGRYRALFTEMMPLPQEGGYTGEVCAVRFAAPAPQWQLSAVRGLR